MAEAADTTSHVAEIASAAGNRSLTMRRGMAGPVSPLSSLLGNLRRIGGMILRGVLALAAITLVAWSFWRVGVREFSRLGEAVATDDIELVVMHWSGDGGPEEDAIVEEALARFETEHPGVRVRRINPGDAGSFYTKLQTMLVAGEPPDVFYVGAERLSNFVELGLLASLEEFVGAGDDEAASSFDLGAFFPATVDAFRYDGDRVGTGPLYGIPKDFTTVGFYLNLDLLKRAGVEPPGDDWTWDEFIEIARRVGELPDATGAEFVTWPVMVRVYLWTQGLDVVGEDFDDLRLDDPEVVAALETLRAWRHEEENTLTSGRSRVASGSAVFQTGRVGMAGPFGRWVVPAYSTLTPDESKSAGEIAFEWDFLPLPRGSERANVVLTVAWAIAERCEHKREAWELVEFLTSAENQAAQSRLGLAVPTRRAVAESDAFLDESVPPANDRAYLDAAEVARVAEWPVDPRFEQLFGSRMDQALRSGDLSLADAAEDFEANWRRVRESPLADADRPTMPWNAVAIAAAAVLAVGGFAATWRLRRGSPATTGARAEERAGWWLASPWLVGFAVFMAFPIAMSAALSLTTWNGVSTLGEASFVGLDNYRELLVHDRRMHTSLRVTAYYALLAVPLGQIAALAAAMLLHAKAPATPLFRAALYLPSVLAGVGTAVLWRWVFDGEDGLMNAALAPLLAPLGVEPPQWFGADAAWFGPPAFAIMSLWTIGGSMLIYLAGLQGIPKELVEAAAIDGAGAWRRFRNVTLPMLSPVVLFNVIVAVIGSFQVFTQAFVMTGGEPGDLTRFYVLYLFNLGFESYEMGYASAMAWILLVVVLLLTVAVLRGSRSLVHYEGLKA